MLKSLFGFIFGTILGCVIGVILGIIGAVFLLAKILDEVMSPPKPKKESDRGFFVPPPKLGEKYGILNIRLPDKEKAQKVYDGLTDHILDHGYATVGDYYELSGTIKFPRISDESYGWTTNYGMRVAPIGGGGWMVDLPEPQKLGSE